MTRILRDIYENEYAVLKSHTDECRRQYRLSLTRWGEFLGREPTTDDLTSLGVQAYVASRRAIVKAATARKDRNQLVALWSYAAKRRYVEEFPTVAQVKAPGRIPRGYTVDDVSALLREALKRRPPMAATPVPPHVFLPTLIRSCWETAERIGAHIGLTWDNVDLQARYVIFAAESRKGATRDIIRPISADLAAWLAESRKCGHRHVWPWSKHKTVLWHHFGILCKYAGVTNRGFHGLRKSAASYMALAGGDATQLLDHSNPAITRNHYIDVTIAKPRQTAIDLLPPLDLTERPHRATAAPAQPDVPPGSAPLPASQEDADTPPAAS